MMVNKFGEMIHDEQDLVDLIMQGHAIWNQHGVTIADDVDVDHISQHLPENHAIVTWHHASNHSTVEEFDQEQQSRWFMPEAYRDIDIAQHIVMLADNDVELQRLGQELLLFHEAGLFDLLRYLRYLVDVMRDNGVIWGVGRGSSVASFVLYKLGVHRINSLYYDLDPHEFLR
jgi:DNA polymerase III alpha subunit